MTAPEPFIAFTLKDVNLERISSSSLASSKYLFGRSICHLFFEVAALVDCFVAEDGVGITFDSTDPNFPFSHLIHIEIEDTVIMIGM